MPSTPSMPSVVGSKGSGRTRSPRTEPAASAVSGTSQERTQRIPGTDLDDDGLFGNGGFGTRWVGKCSKEGTVTRNATF
jgi:hypothetical protein